MFVAHERGKINSCIFSLLDALQIVSLSVLGLRGEEGEKTGGCRFSIEWPRFIRSPLFLLRVFGLVGPAHARSPASSRKACRPSSQGRAERVPAVVAFVSKHTMHAVHYDTYHFAAPHLEGVSVGVEVCVWLKDGR